MGASPRRGLVRETVNDTDVSAGAAALGNGTGSKTQEKERRVKVYVAAENRLLREALARMLTKKGEAQLCGSDEDSSVSCEDLIKEKPDILLLTSRGMIAEDLHVIRCVRQRAPFVRILLLGMDRKQSEFLQCVRAGISGYLLRDASSVELLAAVHAVHAGEAVCPGTLCAALFQYFEQEAAAVPCASAKRRLGLTRREQQMIPLLAQGLTNKEIANHFSLSEQTVKNHVYRMKHKIGAEDRLDIVQVFRTQGYLV